MMATYEMDRIHCMLFEHVPQEAAAASAVAGNSNFTFLPFVPFLRLWSSQAFGESMAFWVATWVLC